jgi:hypothetical protein
MSDQEHDNVRAMWSEDELDRALAALRPPTEPSARTHSRVKAEILIAAGAREPVTPEPRPKRRWGWWAGSAATVAAVAAGVLIVQTVQFDHTIPSAAAEQLNSAADRTGATDEPLAPGQYRYLATHAWWMASGTDYAYLAENLLETWLPADQKQEWLWRRDVTGARKWLAGNETDNQIHETGWPEGEWRAPCGDWYAAEEGRRPCTQEGGWQVPTAEFLAALPRDPDRLYERLRKDTEGKGTDANLEMVVYVADVLRTGQVPADLRASLYRALAKVEGLQITEQVANVDGRKGTAYGISAAGERHDVIVDPATGQFIGERQITEDGYDDIPAGTVTEYTSVTTAVVSGIGVTPPG